jgi:hypothetical protein
MTSVCTASTDQTKGSQSGFVGDDAFPRERWVQALQSLDGDHVLKCFSREIPPRENTEAWDCILSVVKCLTFQQIQHFLIWPFRKLRDDPQRVATLLSLPAKECAENMLASVHVFVSACYFNLCDIPSWRVEGFSSMGALKFLIEGVDSGDKTTRRLCPLYLALCSSRKPHTLLSQYICDAQWLDKKKAYVDLFMSFAGNYDVENIVLGELMSAGDDSVVLKQLLKEMPATYDNHFCIPSWYDLDVTDRRAELHSARKTFCRILLRLTPGAGVWRSGIHADLEDSCVSSSKCLLAPNTCEHDISRKAITPVHAKGRSRENSMDVNVASETRVKNGCEEKGLRQSEDHCKQVHHAERVNQKFTHTESVCGHEVGRKAITPALAKVRSREISTDVNLTRVEDGCNENGLHPRKHRRIQGHHTELANKKSLSGFESPESSKLFQNVQSFLHELCSQDEMDLFHNTPGTLISKGNSMLCMYLKKLMSERRKRTITGAGIETCALQLGPLIGNFLGTLSGWTSTMDYSNAKLLARILHAFFSVLLTAKRTFECLWDDKFGNHMGSIHWKIALLRLCEHPSENEDLGKVLPHGITTALNNWSEVIETIAQKRQYHKIVYLSIQKLECKSNILACFEDAASMTSSQTCAFAYFNALKNMLHSSDPLNEMPRPIFESLSSESSESNDSVKSSSVMTFCDHALLVFQRCESSLEALGAKAESAEPTIRLVTAIIASLMLYTHTRRILLHGGMIRAFAKLLARESLKVGITVNASIAVSYAFTRSFEEEDAVSKKTLCQNLLESELLPVTAKYLSEGDHRVDPRLVTNGLEIARYAIDVITECEDGPTKQSLVETLSKSKIYTAVSYLLASHTFVQMVEGDDSVFLDLYTAATQLSHLYGEFDVDLNEMDEIVLAKRLVLMARNHVDAERRKEVFGFMRHDLALKSDSGAIRQFLSKVLKVKR